jgi:hypothetical protein
VGRVHAQAGGKGGHTPLHRPAAHTQVMARGTDSTLIRLRPRSRRRWLLGTAALLGGVAACAAVALIVPPFLWPSPTAFPPQPHAGTAVYLSEMEPVEAVEWIKEPPAPPPEHGGKRRGKRPPFAGVRIFGKLSPHGIFMHPPLDPEGGQTRISYRLAGQYRTFRAGVSQNDCPQESETPMTFSVLGDGKLLWKSRPVRSPDDSQLCDVRVDGVAVLTIEVDCPGEPRHAHAVWVEPHVVR